jgi:transcriptional regulator with XRE-family HTH domain
MIKAGGRITVKATPARSANSCWVSLASFLLSFTHTKLLNYLTFNHKQENVLFQNFFLFDIGTVGSFTLHKKKMIYKLTQKEIGQRVLGLRKKKGLSQDDLARNLKMSRSSVAQIELGNRSIDILELQKLSEVLGFSIDDFMSRDFSTEDALEEDTKSTKKTEDIRISVPVLHLPKFKNILLYILERCAGKPNIGETVLYKLLYFADFNYYEMYEEHLTGAQYRKLPFGPVPQKLDAIVNKMIEEGQLQRVKAEYHGFPQTRYLPLIKTDLTQLKASEKETIDKVIQQMSDWSASAISSYSHKDMPWLASKEGELIDYELAFYREPPFSARNYDNEMEDQ